jgi:putative transport protein
VSWATSFFHDHPELAVYLSLGLGYIIGSWKLRGFSLGGSTGSLIAGLLIGGFLDVPVSATAKSVVFMLFLFAIGYEVGPKFAKAMKGDGWRFAVLGVFVPVVGLLTAWAVARFLKLDPGFSGGLVSGGLTESPAMGMAAEAINGLKLAAEEKEKLVGHVAVADALCYVFGAFGVIWVCGTLGPKLLRIDLREEAQKLEKEYGIEGGRSGKVVAWRPVEVRAFRVTAGGAKTWPRAGDLERRIPDKRVYVLKLRRGKELLDVDAGMELRDGDLIAVSGPREILVKFHDEHLKEEEDRELLDMPLSLVDVFVTSDDVDGKTLKELGSRDHEALRGVYLRKIMRAGQEIPIGFGTVVERGDILTLVGPADVVEATGRRLGAIVSTSEKTDFRVLGMAATMGAIVGIIAGVDWAGFHLSLGSSVGVLLAGILVGWLHSRRPLFGRIPEPAVSFMQSLGLSGFVAMVGLGAGPHFIPAIREAGLGLFFGGMVVTMVPQIAGLYFGRHVLKCNPLLLLGGLSGAQTFTPGLAAVQEKSGSGIAVLGYSGSVAIAHVLLPMWGSVIVFLTASHGGGS